MEGECNYQRGLSYFVSAIRKLESGGTTSWKEWWNSPW